MNTIKSIVILLYAMASSDNDSKRILFITSSFNSFAQFVLADCMHDPSKRAPIYYPVVT